MDVEKTALRWGWGEETWSKHGEKAKWISICSRET